MKRVLNSKNVFKIEVKPGVPQRLATMLWVPLSSVVIWVISAIEITHPLSFLSFVKTVLILFAGGFAYHFFIMLIEAPFNNENKMAWWRIVGYMSSIMLLFLLNGIVILALAHFQSNLLLLLFLFLFLATYIVSFRFTTKIQRAYEAVYHEMSRN